MPLIEVEKKSEAITYLHLNRPDKRNALTIDLMDELSDQIEELQNDPKQRVIVIKGKGKVFCSGLDLEEATDLEKAHNSALAVARVLKILYNTPLITIASVQKAAIAGGAGLMSACDFVVATKETKIGYPEVHRGLVAGLVMTFLYRQLGQRAAKELLLLGETITSFQALEIGLINRVVEENKIEEEIEKIIKQLLKGAPMAIKHTKNLLDQMHHRSVDEDIQMALSHHMEARESKEAEEGILAFLEKREPQFSTL